MTNKEAGKTSLTTTAQKEREKREREREERRIKKGKTDLFWPLFFLFVSHSTDFVLLFYSTPFVVHPLLGRTKELRGPHDSTGGGRRKLRQTGQEKNKMMKELGGCLAKEIVPSKIEKPEESPYRISTTSRRVQTLPPAQVWAAVTSESFLLLTQPPPPRSCVACCPSSWRLFNS